MNSCRYNVATIKFFSADDGESNGPMLYLKLLPYFVPELRPFRLMLETQARAKAAVEKAWLYRVEVLSMSLEGRISRAGIFDALSTQKTDLEKVQSRKYDQVRMLIALAMLSVKTMLTMSLTMSTQMQLSTWCRIDLLGFAWFHIVACGVEWVPMV